MKISRTYLRTPETMDRYIRDRSGEADDKDPFADRESLAIATFDHWVIIENKYPYDAIATVSHMLFTRRDVSFDWELLNRDELNELSVLHRGYLAEHYDVVWENLPGGRTVPAYFHLHLLKLRRAE